MFGRKKKEKPIKVRVEKLSPEQTLDESKLVEIKDEMILARLNQAVPELAVAVCTGVKTAAAENATYKAVLPSSTHLAPTREVKGAFKGLFQRNAGVALVGMGAVSTAATLAFGVAALVVGQKYLADISKSINKLNMGIGRVSSFQHSEYKSKVDALIDRITVILSYRYEYIENTETRNRTLIELSELETTCTQLLGQANDTIEKISSCKFTEFETYCDNVREVQCWMEFQDKLLAVLYHIGQLKYALGMGTLSKEACASLFGVYFEKTARSKKALKSWHNEERKVLKIDAAGSKRKRQGADAFVHLLPGLVNEDNKYRALPEDVSALIRLQRTSEVIDYNPLGGKSFEDGAEIIVRDGKVYYYDN